VRLFSITVTDVRALAANARAVADLPGAARRGKAPVGLWRWPQPGRPECEGMRRRGFLFTSRRVDTRTIPAART
jgi:hypothetical protein